MRVINLTQTTQGNYSAAHQAATTLRQGKLVIYPTDTVYGIAACATNQAAVAALKKFKGQRGSKPISIAVRDQAMAEMYVSLNNTAKHLYQTFLPGPLTVVSVVSKTKNHQSNVADSAGKLSKPVLSSRAAERNVMSTATRDPEERRLATGIASIDYTVGIRIIPHSFVSELFRHIDFPITATSANISGGANPRSLDQWLKNTPEKKQALVALFIDAGELPYAQPSTVIDTSKEDTAIVRQGSLDTSFWSRAKLDDRIPSESGKPLSTKFNSHSPEETKTIAKQFYSDTLSSLVARQTLPVIIALQGPLGAGKTVFTQGLAQAVGITEPLRSPTYTLVKEYIVPSHRQSSLDQRRSFYHIDAWRLSSPEEFQDLGINDMLKEGNIIVIEWPQRLHSLMTTLEDKAKLVVVDIRTETATRRSLTVAF